MAMTVREIATGLVEKCRAGDFGGAMVSYYHPDIESVEGDGSMQPAGRVRGLAACQGKGEYWQQANEVHSMGVDGPYLGDSHFCVIFDIDITERASGRRMQGKEIAYYRVDGGQIVYENFMGLPMG